MAKELLKREEVKVEDTWDLTDMYESNEAWEEELNKIEALITEIAGMEGTCLDTAKNLLTVLEKDAACAQKIELAYSYAERLFDQDQKNTKHQSMSAKIMSVYAKYAASTAFISPEIIAASSELLEKYFKEIPELELYRKQIDEIIRMKPHRLSAEM